MWGIGLLFASMWVLPFLDASGKWLVGHGVAVIFLSWMRYVVHLLVMLAAMVPGRGLRVLRSRRPRDQILRGASMLGGTLMFFSTLHYLPQSEATAINFLSPLILLLVAPWVLREPSRPSRWIAAGCAFAGVLVIIRPGSGLDPVGVTLGLLSAFCFAAQYIFTRRVASDDPYTSIIWSGAVGALVLTPMLLLPSADDWSALREIGPGTWLLLCSTGLTGALGHLLQIAAYRNAPASALAPFTYFSVITATVVGWLVTGHFPDAVTWIGIGVIFVSGVGTGIYEWRMPRKAQA
ncbi:MAG TPA: DMT family transporter [Bordetella sp.]